MATTIPVFDTAWQMLAKATPHTAEKYAVKLKQVGFTGCWSFLLMHPNTTIHDSFNGGGHMGFIDRGGNMRLNDDYVSHVRAILDRFSQQGVKMGLGVAWQNSYLPGGDPNHHVAGLLHEGNSRAYGSHIALAFSDHPAIDHLIVGGDAGKNNTDANIQVWRNFAEGLADMGNNKRIAYHSPTRSGNENDPNNTFRHLNYANEPWLNIAGLETGHTQGPGQTEWELTEGVKTYNPNGIECWQGEPRYTGYTGTGWPFNNYGLEDAVADAEAAKRAGVQGYVFGTWARWPWAGHGFDPANPQNSFSDIEDAVIAVFAGAPPPPTGNTMQLDIRAAGATGTEQIQVRTASGNQGPVIHLTTAEQVYLLDIPQTEIHTLQVAFINDGSDNGSDRNARIVSVGIDGHVYPTVHPNVLSTGTWEHDTGCAPGYKQSSWLHCAGHFDFSEVIPAWVPTDPPPAGCDPVAVEELAVWADDLAAAAGRLADGIRGLS